MQPLATFEKVLHPIFILPMVCEHSPVKKNCSRLVPVRTSLRLRVSAVKLALL